MQHRLSRMVPLALIALASCRSQHPGFVAPQPEPQDPLETIARYEDARIDGDGLLQTLLQKGDTRTRERAAVALGRLDPTELGAEVTDGLVAGLGDESGSVRAAAAFGLGERADPSAAGALLAHWHDPDPNVRARIVEAGSRIDDARLRTAVLASLDDADARVRSEAVFGISRFPAARTDARDAEIALIEHFEPAARVVGLTLPVDELLRWEGLFTLSRNKSQRTEAQTYRVRGFCVIGLASPDVRARIFAAKALAEMPAQEASSAALTKALRDQDWRVACEAAVALGKQDALNAISGLAEALKHPSPHVRRAVCQALGSPQLRGEARTASSMLTIARSDPSPEVRAAVLEAEATLLGRDALDRVHEAAGAGDPLARAAAASAAARLDPDLALPLLLDLTRDPNLRVAGIAIEGLGKQASPAAHDRLVELLSANDNGLRLAAVMALKDGKLVAPQDGPAFVACMQSTSGEISGEVAAAILDVSEELPKESSRLIASAAVVHPDPYVRKKLRTMGGWRSLVKDAPSAPRPSQSANAIAFSEPPRGQPNPRVEIVTNRGTMIFELFPAEAPNTVRNLLELAARHHYDGLSFHRVELDFVIQGGDHRGDGNGGITWNDAPLRAEFTPRKFVRGSLGMPRNDDPDSGGSQFFVTHRDTPHLDGRYTNFGMLVAGFDTLDAIEVGDTIQTVRVVPAQ